MARGLTLSLVSAPLACIALGLLHLAFSAETLGGAAAQTLMGQSGWYVFFAAIVFAPLFETFVGQLLPIELARRVGARDQVCILVSATLFSLGHLYSGGIASAVATFIGGGVFAYAYVSVRGQGYGAGYIAAVCAHAAHNALLIYIADPLFS